MSKLFTPIQVGPYRLSHRVVMAPLTRMRSDPGDIPSDLMVKYYTQRASDGGLIVSEATPVSIRGNGYARRPDRKPRSPPGVRISPSGMYGSMSDSNPPATFDYVATQLDRLGIAYLHVVEPRIKGTEEISHGQAPIAASATRAPRAAIATCCTCSIFEELHHSHRVAQSPVAI
jgi:2,4-dienoyl-CoA reductase-like NADH-dependent reductase (Old Yellow Enzyme family)